jgi:succinate dehydrogenase cytochrome b556 subunit
MKKINQFLRSPSLGVYNLQVTSFSSIFQRIFGVFLFFILLFIFILQTYEIYFISFFRIYFFLNFIFESSVIIFDTILIWGSIVFFYHFFNGLRFVIFDGLPGFKYSEELKLDKHFQSTIFIISLVFFFSIFFYFFLIF